MLRSLLSPFPASTSRTSFVSFDLAYLHATPLQHLFLSKHYAKRKNFQGHFIKVAKWTKIQVLVQSVDRVIYRLFRPYTNQSTEFYVPTDWVLFQALAGTSVWKAKNNADGGMPSDNAPLRLGSEPQKSDNGPGKSFRNFKFDTASILQAMEAAFAANWGVILHGSLSDGCRLRWPVTSTLSTLDFSSHAWPHHHILIDHSRNRV